MGRVISELNAPEVRPETEMKTLTCKTVARLIAARHEIDQALKLSAVVPVISYAARNELSVMRDDLERIILGLAQIP